MTHKLKVKETKKQIEEDPVVMNEQKPESQVRERERASVCPSNFILWSHLLFLPFDRYFISKMESLLRILGNFVTPNVSLSSSFAVSLSISLLIRLAMNKLKGVPL